jgi:hypothetical protein
MRISGMVTGGIFISFSLSKILGISLASPHSQFYPHTPHYSLALSPSLAQTLISQ